MQYSEPPEPPEPEPPEPEPPEPERESDAHPPPLDRRAKAALIGLAALAAGLGIALALIAADPPTEKIVVTNIETTTKTETPTTTTLTTSTVTTTTTTETTTDETVTETTTAPPETTTVTESVPGGG